jgi:Na+/proline symporter
MLAASISTYAGYFLGWSSIIAQDIVGPLLAARSGRRPTPGSPVQPGDEASAILADPTGLGTSGSLGMGLSNRARLRLTRLTVVGLTVFIMVWSLVYDLPGPAYFYLQVTANLFMAPTLIAVVGGLYWRRASPAGALLSFLLGAGTSLAYLVPSLKLGVATAGNLSWGLAVAGFVAGSFLFPRRPAPEREGARR